MSDTCFLTIITVAKDDSWSLQKTMRSVFEQSSRQFEYIVVDGASTDGSQDLIEFWRGQGLVTRAISEPDNGVYDAMNKGLKMANGTYVIFLNAGDVFPNSNVIDKVISILSNNSLDGLLGWGELGDKVWASWTESEAFVLASLGFCHQALYVRRALLLKEPFDSRPHKTDSDTLQLGRLYGAGARIPILPEVLAIRGIEPGISANLERSAESIRGTLVEVYPGMTISEADAIISFRRRCEYTEEILAMMTRAERRLASHLARMILDTLFQGQSAKLDRGTVSRLTDAAFAVLLAEPEGATEIQRLIVAQNRRAEMLRDRRERERAHNQALSKFESEENQRIAKCHSQMVVKVAAQKSDVVVSLTSFPARLRSVAFAIQSLFEQTCPPAEIHLWLGRDEVPGINWLPNRLRALQERGLHVHFSRRTFHQYDKFLHNAELNRNRPFVIVDDDVIYPPASMESLVEAHKCYPDAVIGNRCHLMAFQPDGTLAPYKTWEREVNRPEPDLLLFPTGAGGVLYPPGFLIDPVVTNVNQILRNAPYADDIWLKASALIRGIPSFSTKLSHKADWYHRYTPDMVKSSLMAMNVERGLNDDQIRASMAVVECSRPGWRRQRLEMERATA